MFGLFSNILTSSVSVGIRTFVLDPAQHNLQPPSGAQYGLHHLWKKRNILEMDPSLMGEKGIVRVHTLIKNSIFRPMN